MLASSDRRSRALGVGWWLRVKKRDSAFFCEQIRKRICYTSQLSSQTQRAEPCEVRGLSAQRGGAPQKGASPFCLKDSRTKRQIILIICRLVLLKDRIEAFSMTILQKMIYHFLAFLLILGKAKFQHIFMCACGICVSVIFTCGDC